MGEETLDVLLIEDNPGDVRLIEEMLRDAETLLQRVDASIGGGSRLHHERTVAAGLDRLADGDIDVVLLDLGLPETTGLDTLTAVTDETEYLPVVVLTGLDDDAVGLEAIRCGAQDYLVKGNVTSDLLVRTIHYAIERARQERDRVRRRERLATLDRLNRIGQDVTHAVITSSTREELEQAVCEQFAESDVFRFAWIGDLDHVTDRVVPHAAAGVDASSLDDLTTADDGDTVQEMARRAVQTETVQVVLDVQTPPPSESWGDEATERDYRSAASIPIVHEELLYGVLTVYAGSPTVFSGSDQETLSRLGQVVGHAITAIERKEALMSDTVLELEFQAEDVVDELVALTTDSGGTVEFEEFIRTNDGLVTFGRVEGVQREAFRDAALRTSLVDDIRLLSTGDDGYEFELVTTSMGSLVDAVATHAGRITSATVRDGTFRFVVEFPPGRDKRPLIELVEEHSQNAWPVAQRTVERSVDPESKFRTAFQDRLSEKQYAALKTAYLAGHFEWPRQSTGQEIAESLGISSPTFNEHMRIAEKKFFDAVFADHGDGRPE